MTHRFSFDIDHEIDGAEAELRVVYEVRPGCAAQLYGDYPRPEEPDEVEIISIKRNGVPITLSASEEDAILQMAIERSGSDMADEFEAAQEWRAQSRRDRLMEGF